MSDIVFILGAGASRDCGAPLMNDFFEKAEDLLAIAAPEIKSKFKTIDRARSTLQQVHSKSSLDTRNIESVFTALEMAKVLGRLPGFEKEEIADAIEELKQLIVYTLENSISFPAANATDATPGSYGRFVDQLISLKKASRSLTSAIVTFNYDLCIDFALWFRKRVPLYHLGTETLTEFSIPLAKLHGSLNWFTLGDGRSTHVILPQDLVRANAIRSTNRPDMQRAFVGTDLRRLKGIMSLPELAGEAPLIVPPTWSKHTYTAAIEPVWAAAASHLATAKYVVIIGYSLPDTDSFFKLLFALGTVSATHIRKIVVCNPDSSVQGRFKAMLGTGLIDRFEYHNWNFRETANSLPDLF